MPAAVQTSKPAAATPRALGPARKRGPKPKLDSEKRMHQANCRLTDEEWLELNQRRGALAPAEALRILALSRTLPRAIPEINLLAYQELAKTASNLNQLSRRANQGDQIENMAELGAILAQLRAALLGVSDEFKEAIKAKIALKLDDDASSEQSGA